MSALMVRSSILLAASVAAADFPPVVFMHGIGGSHADGNAIKTFLTAQHKGQRVELLQLDEGVPASWKAMDRQLTALASRLAALQRNFSLERGGNGSFHLVGHSQGALLARTALEVMDGHQVDSFVSLAGPQLGVFAIPDSGAWPKWLQNLTSDDAYHALYSDLAQATVSFAGYWHDPRLEAQYASRCKFLPRLNNLVPHNRSAAFRANFLRTRNAVFVGGPDDGVIIPWQTTQWGYLAPTNASSEPSAMARMEDLPAYANDSFGLRALDQAGRLHRAVVPGVQHVHFLRDERVLKIIEPWLR